MPEHPYCADFPIGINIPQRSDIAPQGAKGNGANAPLLDWMNMLAKDIINSLALQPHPEGGWYRQTWVADAKDDTRPSGTAIYYLLEKGQKSHWHHVDATEIWHFYAGAPLILSISEHETSPAQDHILGPDVLNDAAPQILVPRHHWQAARSTGDWTLAGCTVSPAFQFEGFHLAPDGFDIPRS